MLQKQAKDWKGRVDQAYGEATKAKNELIQMKNDLKSEERSKTAELERMAHNYSQLQSQLKQKDFELSSTRKEATKKKSTFEETRQLIGKLQREEQRHVGSRTSPVRADKSPIRADVSPIRSKPTRSYKEEKEQYLSII